MQPLPTLNNLLQIDLPYIYPFQNSKKSHEIPFPHNQTPTHQPPPIVPKRKKNTNRTLPTVSGGRTNLLRRFRVASHEGHQIRAKRQFPSLRQLATLAFPQLWRFIAGGDDTQARSLKMGRYGPNRHGPWCSQRSGEINMFQVKKWIKMIQIMERLCYSSSWHVFQSWKLRAESLPQDFWQGKTIKFDNGQTTACQTSFLPFCFPKNEGWNNFFKNFSEFSFRTLFCYSQKNSQADQERPKFPPWTEKGHSVDDSIVFHP